MTDKQNAAAAAGILTAGGSVAEWFANNMAYIMAGCIIAFAIMFTCSIVRTDRKLFRKKL